MKRLLTVVAISLFYSVAGHAAGFEARAATPAPELILTAPTAGSPGSANPC